MSRSRDQRAGLREAERQDAAYLHAPVGKPNDSGVRTLFNSAAMDMGLFFKTFRCDWGGPSCD
ncbi:hypothetical protein CCR78_01105 [Rhodovulum imhoffii]|nr:hypothetical protein [Rhodovulum imhoffii]